MPALAQLATVVIDCGDQYRWPSPVKQTHLDFLVADLDKAVARLLALGATRPDFQPGDGQWVVLADPQGHLLCLAAGD